MVTSNQVKELRNQTGAGYMTCKKALVASKGNMKSAIIYLREKGVSIAKKKSARPASEGIIGTYLHSNEKMGVLIEVCCETDFAASTAEFKNFAKDMAMHVAAMSPEYISPENVPQELIELEEQIYKKQLESVDKPQDIIDNIVSGKIKKYCSNVCLLEQPYFRDNNYSVRDILNQCIAKIGENIEIKRFVRFEVEK